MKTSMLLALPVTMMLPALAMAQSAFVGTWKADLNNIQLPTKPDKYLLDKGTYQCGTCVPSYSVPADGQDHPISGNPRFDTANVKVVDANTVMETYKKDGKTVSTITDKVAGDGRSYAFDVSDSSASTTPVMVKGESMRVTKGPPGSHAISGSWRTTKFENVSDNGLLVTYALSGSTLKMSSPTGQSYSATLDGTDSPFLGDPGQTSVAMKKIDDRTIEETDKRDGKVIGSARLKVAADGKSMRVDWKDALHGTSGAYTELKQ